MNKKLIIANGCSMASGFECTKSAHQMEEDWNYAWPAKIAEHYNIKHINLSQAGQSNYSISINLQSEILKRLKTTPAEDILVLVGWTEFTRTEYITDNHCINLNAGTAELVFKEGISKELNYIKSDIELGVKSWVRQSLDSHMNKFIWVYWGLIQFLENHNIKYFFFNAITKPYCPDYDLLCFNTRTLEYIDSPSKDVWHRLINDKCYDTTNTQFDWLKTYWPDHTLGNGLGQKHWNPEALDAWANYLIPKIDLI